MSDLIRPDPAPPHHITSNPGLPSHAPPVLANPYHVLADPTMVLATPYPAAPIHTPASPTEQDHTQSCRCRVEAHLANPHLG